MSIEDLQDDLGANLTEVAALAGNPLVTAPELAAHLAGTLWPFLKNVVIELDEMDGTVADLYRNAEDILQPETAGMIGAVIVTATGLIGKELIPRLNPKTPKDAKVLAAIAEWTKMAKEASEEIEAITVTPADGIETDDDDDEDEPAEGDDDDEDDTEDGDDDGDDADDDDDGKEP